MLNNIFSGNKQKIYIDVEKIINYCKFLLSEIQKSNSDEYTKNMIIEHMYIIYICYKHLGLIKLVSDVKIEEYDEMIEKYLCEYLKSNNNLKMFEKMYKISKNKKNKDEMYFFENMIDKCVREQNNIYQKDIKKMQEEIYEKLEENVKLDDKKFGEYNVLNNKTYNNIQKNMKDLYVRREIDKIYCLKSVECMGKLEKIVILRNEIAKKMKYKNYFEYVKRRENYDSEKIIFLIEDMIKKIDERAKKETHIIKKKLLEDGFKKKIEFSDIIYYHDKMCFKKFFILKNILNVLFYVIKKYFNIEIEEKKNDEELWDKNVRTFVAKYDNVFLGYIYIDLDKNEIKKINLPICVHLQHYYVDQNGKKYDTKIALIGNYEKYVSHQDLVYLFSEMGNVIHFLLYKTETGDLYFRDDLYLITSKIMEHIVWEKDILLKLCENSDNNKDENIVKQILFTKYIDFSNSLKLRCVIAYFDNIIHSSEELHNKIKSLGKYDGELFCLLYKNIYKNIFSSQKDDLNVNIENINPMVLMQEINGTEGYVYQNILVEIFSYGVFNLIKNDKKNIDTYIKILMKGRSDIFKELLSKFINKIENNYNLYLQEVNGNNEINDKKNLFKHNSNKNNSNKNNINDLTQNEECSFIIDKKIDLEK